jgi:hypothetical protein
VADLANNTMLDDWNSTFIVDTTPPEVAVDIADGAYVNKALVTFTGRTTGDAVTVQAVDSASALQAVLSGIADGGGFQVSKPVRQRRQIFSGSNLAEGLERSFCDCWVRTARFD